MKYIDLPHLPGIYVSFTTNEKDYNKELKRTKAQHPHFVDEMLKAYKEKR